MEIRVKKEIGVLDCPVLKGTVVLPGLKDLLGPQDRGLSAQETGPRFSPSQGPEDHQGRQDPLALQASLEEMENLVTLVKMATLGQLDLVDSQGRLETLGRKDRRVSVVRDSQVPVDHLAPLAPRGHLDPETDLPTWTWRVLAILIWRVLGASLDCLDHLGLLVPQVPLAMEGPLDLGQLELLANRAPQVFPALQGDLDHQDPREMLVNWVCLEQWVKRAPRVMRVLLAFQGRLDSPACLVPWDLSDNQDLLDLLGLATVLALMTWRALAWASFLADLG